MMEQAITLKTMSLKVKLALMLTALGVSILFGLYLGMTYGRYMSPLWWLLIFAIGIVATIPLHEGLHGLFFKIFGGKVSFGAKLKTPFGPVFWATSDKLYSKRQFQMISLAPQILTLVLVLLIVFVELPPVVEIGLFIIAAGNLCGGGFDIYISCKLTRFPAGVLIRDMKDGLMIYE